MSNDTAVQRGPVCAAQSNSRGHARVTRRSSVSAGEDAMGKSFASEIRPLRPRHPTGFLALAVVALVSASGALAYSADDRAKMSAGPVLHLTNGGYVAGDLKASTVASRLGWQSPL